MRLVLAGYMIAVAVLIAACGGRSVTRETPTATPTRTPALPFNIRIMTPYPTPIPTTPTPTPTPQPASATIQRDVPVFISAATNGYVLGTLPAGSRVDAYRTADKDWLVLPGLGFIQSDPSAVQLSRPLEQIDRYSSALLGIWSPAYPQGTHTGIAEVDHVIDLTESGDAAGILGLELEQPYPCVTGYNGPVYGPQCPPGVAIGTPVNTFHSSGCEGYFGPKSTSVDAMSRAVSEVRLLSVSAAVHSWDPPDPGIYFVMFVRQTPPGAFGLDIAADGRIIDSLGNCGSLGGEIRPPFLLSPIRPAALQP